MLICRTAVEACAICPYNELGGIPLVNPTIPPPVTTPKPSWLFFYPPIYNWQGVWGPPPYLLKKKKFLYIKPPVVIHNYNVSKFRGFRDWWWKIFINNTIQVPIEQLKKYKVCIDTALPTGNNQHLLMNFIVKSIVFE